MNCTICGLSFTDISWSAGVCPSCDAGDFGITKVKRQEEIIRKLNAQVGPVIRQTDISALRRLSIDLGKVSRLSTLATRKTWARKLRDIANRLKQGHTKAQGAVDTLGVYTDLHKHKLVGMHWLWAAVERVAAGEDEAEVMADFGYVGEKS